MEKREQKLIQLLKNKTLTSKELATLLNVSSRTILNDIDRLNKLSNGELIIYTTLGYKINDAISHSYHTKESTATQEQRLMFIVQKLLLSNENINIFDLADKFIISESVIKKDLVYFNKKYSDLKVRLQTQNNYIEIIGDEISKRKVMMRLLQTYNFSQIMSKQEIIRIFKKENVDLVQNALNSIENKYKLIINDFSRINIILHVLIIISRINQGYIIDCVSDSNNFNEIFGMIGNEFISYIENQLNLNFSQVEKKQIFLSLAGNIKLKEKTSNYTISNIIPSELNEFVTDLFSEINHVFYLDLTDQNFILSFAMHIDSLILRMKNNRYTQNPMKKNIRSSSPFLYDIALFIFQKICEKYNLEYEMNEDELSFIVIHLGLEIERIKSKDNLISCALYIPKYLNIQEDLSSKIMDKYGDLISKFCIFSDISTLSLLDYDLIISLTDIYETKFSASIISISPFLDKRDMNKIGESLDNLIIKKQVTNFKINFRKLFHDDLYFYDENKTIQNKDDAITLLSNLLIKQNFVESSFTEHVFERENAISTAYSNFAIPHSISKDAKQNAIAVLISKHGITWDDKKVFAVFMICMAENRICEIQSLYEGMLPYLLDTNIVNELSDCANFESFENKFINYPILP